MTDLRLKGPTVFRHLETTERARSQKHERQGRLHVVSCPCASH